MHVMELGFHQDLIEITFGPEPAQRRKVISLLTTLQFSLIYVLANWTWQHNIYAIKIFWVW